LIWPQPASFHLDEELDLPTKIRRGYWWGEGIDGVRTLVSDLVGLGHWLGEDIDGVRTSVG